MLAALGAACIAEAVSLTELIAAVVAEILGELARSCRRLGICLFGGRIYERAVRIYCKSFVMAKVGAASGAVHESVRIPRAVIQIVVGVTNRRLAVFTNLLIGQTAVPLLSLISHIDRPFALLLAMAISIS